MGDIKQYEPLWGAWYMDSLIGEGSFGKVYKVRREEFGKRPLRYESVVSTLQGCYSVVLRELATQAV